MTAVPIGSGLPANDLDGGLLGAQFGYNIQRGDLVYGVEAAFSTANVDTGSTATGCSGVHCAYIDINWTASITARLGKSVNRTLSLRRAWLCDG